jgi:hypothetical protein
MSWDIADSRLDWKRERLYLAGLSDSLITLSFRTAEPAIEAWKAEQEEKK